MTQRTFRIASAAVFLLVIQQAVMRHLHIFGVHPDVLLVFALCAGITGGADRGALAGFAAGLASDIFLPNPLGLSALAYAAAGFVVGSLSDDANELPWVVSLLAIAGTVVAFSVFFLVGSVGADVHTGVRHAVGVTFVTALVNAVFAPFIARFLRKAWQSSLPAKADFRPML